MTKKIALTGIKPTGDLHIGNYLGAIRPALSLVDNYDARYFIADYHALNTIKDPQKLNSMSFEIAASWLAFGLDPQKTIFYRQSDVIETFELATFLSAFTAKGLMNRAHAYKAKIASNLKEGKDEDYSINMGLFTYPILMAADILLFDTDLVPVGRDQRQHIEIAADIAQSINHNYDKDLLKIPKALLEQELDIPGVDGRKMSKSYNNVIPLFVSSKKLRKIIMKIKTNSQSVEESKDPNTCNIFSIYKFFATKEEQEALSKRYLNGGMGWGEAKQELFEVINKFIFPYREKYDDIISDKAYINKVLLEGADKARDIANSTMNRLRKASFIYE